MQAYTVRRDTTGRWRVLTRKVEQLEKDTAKLREPRTVAGMRKALAKVVEDVKQVENLVGEVEISTEEVRVVEPNQSTIAKPVQFVHKFLDNNPTLGRKEAIEHLSRKGVNYSTARTQYQKWFKAQHRAH